jgi:hypothetical protein
LQGFPPNRSVRHPSRERGTERNTCSSNIVGVIPYWHSRQSSWYSHGVQHASRNAPCGWAVGTAAELSGAKLPRKTARRAPRRRCGSATMMHQESHADSDGPATSGAACLGCESQASIGETRGGIIRPADGGGQIRERGTESKAENQVAPRSDYALQAEEGRCPNKREVSVSVDADSQPQRRYRWCKPPTNGSATTRPRSGGSTALGWGAM